ncbi:MAG TPA: pitrilysin family protein [Labilithrix sp.]|nr:pitrilysin family protein [Labilithrix sp.]
MFPDGFLARLRRLSLLLPLGLALWTGPALAEGPASTAPLTKTPSLVPEKTTLPNGLEVILDEDHRTPIVTVNLWYHVGSKDEAPHRNGFAHLFEHVMFQGSKHVPEDTYFRFLEKSGASSINGTTNTDRTNYFETVPANQLELALWLESDRMGFLLDHADEKTFHSQRDVVKNERRQNYENAPYGLVGQYVREELFPKEHPYHLLTIGSPADLDAATIDDVRGFFRTHYVPNNATLVLSGDFDRRKAMSLIEKYFGPIPPSPIALPKSPMRTKPPVTAHPGETRIEVEAGVELPRVYISWSTPPLFAPGDGELDLVAHVLSGGKTSRLYKRLVYDLQIAQGVSASQGSMELASTFEIVATAKPGHTAEELLKVIDEELAKLHTGGVTDAELARAKTSILADGVFEIERSSARANRINSYNHYVGDPGYLAKDMARTTNATPTSVAGAARAWLKEKDRVVTLVATKKDAPIAGKVVNVTRRAPASADAPTRGDK